MKKYNAVSLIFALTGLLLFGPYICLADIYKYVDNRGVTHFTNIPTNRNYRFYMRETIREAARCWRKDPQAYDPIIASLCKKYEMDEALVKAVIKAESDFDPSAVSKKGAQGLMQLMPETARDLNVANPFHPTQNLDGGIRYLRKLIDQFQGNLQLALAAYNAGENAVLKYNQIPPYEETRTYVQRVLNYLKDNQTSR
jgi:soluble lytic murein transglycosylase-like protein